jgi:transposase InsO family protein
MADDESTVTVQSQAWDSADEEATTDSAQPHQQREPRLVNLGLPARTDWYSADEASADEAATTDSAPPHQQREPRLAHLGLPGRTDSHPLPTGEDWTWGGEDEEDRIIVLKDGAPASFYAAQEVFPEAQVLNVMCMVHASRQHVSHNKKHFRDHENCKKVQKDLYELKNFPLFGLIDSVKELMLQKWENEYEERAYANIWKNSYKDQIMTRVQTNEGTVWRGGIPCDNNVMESFNNQLKQRLGHTAMPLVPLLGKLRVVVEGFSRNDTSYCGKLKPKVHSRDFYGSIENLLLPDKETKKDGQLRFSFTTLRFFFTSASA